MPRAKWGVRAAMAGVVLASVTSFGCIKKILLDGQISSTRKASAAVNTIGDYEVAERAANAGLGQIEGLRYLAPDNEDAIFMLTRSWASVALGFMEDAMERAEDEEGGTSANYDYHRRRARAAYERAIWYGSQLVETEHEGFKDAQTNDASIREYLKQFDDPEDAEKLFWLGYAWLGRTGVSSEKGEVVGQLFIAVALLERSVELDPTYMNGSGHTALGAYHARTAMAELDEAKQHFDEAIKISEGKVLLPKVQLAIRYYCAKGDKDNYVKTLNEVMAAGDGDPYQRLANTIAKRKAQRWLGEKRMSQYCGF
ncbi:MAG TPA: TRAP transporter TatT component family protein [Polyangiaceae bacterium]|nr:TRAP transporter TatT component family protein [Polyangiaceae bacterium]